MIKHLCTALSTARGANHRKPWSRQYLELFCYGLSFGSDARQWILRLVPLLLLAWLPAQAANYTFPGNMPAGCTNENGAYTCTPLSLASEDTITITGRTAITVIGDLTTGLSTRINAEGDSSNLTITVTGITYLGDYTIFKGNILGTNNATATITTGAHSQVVGNLTTDTAGVINIGADSSVVGNLTTKSGAINVGDRSTITGSILSSLAGAITIGVNVIVTGNVATTYQGSVIGAGAITISSGSEIGGSVTTNTGAITVQANAKVTGNVSSNDGAITAGADSDIGGSVCSGNSGAVTIGARAKVGGNVETAKAGAITIGTLANVTGAVTVQAAGAKTIVDGAIVGDKRTGAKCQVDPTSSTTVPRMISRQWRQIFMR